MLPTRVFPLLSPLPPCPVCGTPSTRALHVYPVNHNKPRATAQLNVALLGCERCGVVCSHPRPSDEALTAYYSRSDGWDDRITEDEAEALRRVRKLRSKHAADLDRLAAVVELPAPGGEPRPRALDFGCGIGGFLSALRDRGWDTFGIEPGRRAAAIAAREHELLETPPGDASLDLVVLHHTLEHLPDPAGSIAALTASLRPGGAIWISVPNLETLGEHRDLDYKASDKHVFT
nr:class I SAM-dependent methyltransferase [Actinomycetota bacterium]